MTDSEVRVTLRQRGISLAVAGLLAQLVGALAVMVGQDWIFFSILLIISTGGTLLSFAGPRDHTAASGVAGAVTLLLAVGEAWLYGASWFGVLVVAVGAALLVFGNKQLAAAMTM